MNDSLNLLIGIFEKEYILLKEYPVDTIGGVIGMYAIFLIIFFGGTAVAGGRVGSALGAIVVGYFLLMMATTSFQGISDTITEEAQWGTLERLTMSPLGIGRVVTFMSLAKLGVSFIWGVSILGLMLLTTDQTISLDLLSVVPIVVFGLATTIGLGLFTSGASILFKRIGSIRKLFGLLFVGFVAAPVEQYPILKALPLAQGSYLLRRVMDDGAAIWELPISELGILVGVGVGYYVLGYAFLLFFTKKAKRRGVLGHY